jgi:hypothetical protein
MNINVGIDLPLGLGSHRQRVDFLYRATTPLIESPTSTLGVVTMYW